MPRSRPRRVMTHLSPVRADLPDQLARVGFECVPLTKLARQRPPSVLLTDTNMNLTGHPEIEVLVRRRRRGVVLLHFGASLPLAADLPVDARLPIDASAHEVALALDLVAKLCDIRRRWRSERRARRQWSHLALHDALTGLPNRRAWDLQLAASLAASQPCFVALVDVDFLKDVNDRAGHDVGDSVLRSIAQTLKSLVRDDNFVARLGGDEFGLILHTENRASTDAFLGQIHNAVAADLARRLLPVKTLSRGYVGIPQDIGADASRVFAAAAQALQAAKQQRCLRAAASRPTGP